MNLSDYLKQQWDRVGSWVAIAVGALVLLLGYIGISGTPHVAAQLPYIISGGLVGIFLLGVGGMLWVSADLRDEWRELHGIRAAIERTVDLTTAGSSGPEASSRRFAPESVDLELDLATDVTAEIPRTVAASVSTPRRRAPRAAAGQAR